MAALVSWEYYSSLYSKVTETDFPKAEALAEKEVIRIVGLIHWGELNLTNLDEEIYGDQLKDCICKVIDFMAEAPKAQGKGIASVSNDGYSESYVLQKQSDALEELGKNIRSWLSGTGIVRAY
jgi:hypothetical protein